MDSDYSMGVEVSCCVDVLAYTFKAENKIPYLARLTPQQTESTCSLKQAWLCNGRRATTAVYFPSWLRKQEVTTKQAKAVPAITNILDATKALKKSANQQPSVCRSAVDAAIQYSLSAPADHDTPGQPASWGCFNNSRLNSANLYGKSLSHQRIHTNCNRKHSFHVYKRRGNQLVDRYASSG